MKRPAADIDDQLTVSGLDDLICVLPEDFSPWVACVFFSSGADERRPSFILRVINLICRHVLLFLCSGSIPLIPFHFWCGRVCVYFLFFVSKQKERPKAEKYERAAKLMKTGSLFMWPLGGAHVDPRRS